MKINYIGNDIAVTDAIKSYVEKRLEKIEKFFSKEIEVDVNFRVQGDMRGVQIAIITGKKRFRAITEHVDLYAAIDKTVDVLNGQITKEKEKNETFERGKPEIKDDFEEELEITNEIIKRVEFDVKPLTPEDAKLILGDSRDVFMVFVNSNTGKTNVLFKLKDGKNYGLIEPEL